MKKYNLHYTKFIKYILRIFNISLSSYIAYLSFNLFYGEYMTFVPDKMYLAQLNTQTGSNLNSLLRDNSAGFREMYYHAFEKSILYSFVIFICCLILVEYIYRSRDREVSASNKRIWEAFGAWKERNVTNNSNISKEHEAYLKDFFKKE